MGKAAAAGLLTRDPGRVLIKLGLWALKFKFGIFSHDRKRFSSFIFFKIFYIKNVLQAVRSRRRSFMHSMLHEHFHSVSDPEQKDFS